MQKNNQNISEKGLLKRLTVLYVEDDENIRVELSSLLKNFFGELYTAQDGEDGYNTFINNQDKIDVILSDINMPKLSGIEMMKQIRQLNSHIPVIFATAYSDSAFLTEAIKIKVYDYIVKPINIRNLLGIFQELASSIYQKFLIEQQKLDLQRYKAVIDANNIVIKTDLDGKILYVNEHFSDTSGYSDEDYDAISFKDLLHKDVDSGLYSEIFSTLKSGNSWQGNLKSRTKFDDEYIVETYAIPDTTQSSEVVGAIFVQKDITAQINQKREIQSALMKAKSKVFLEGKETIAELNAIINDQAKQINQLSTYLKQSELDKARLINLQNKHQQEIKIINNELIELRNQPKPTDFQASSLLKLNKDNMDLKNTIRKLEIEKAKLTKDLEKDIFREKITLEVMVDDLEHELAECREKLAMFSDKGALEETIEYYQTKSKNDDKKLQLLEAKILRLCDKDLAKQIFAEDRKEEREV
ncbi:response regulator [Arcobacter sp. FWKO B]|uniref:response regulator n=1 Tax=Arcobacter sp. FWKO B TaxID=2593672 RepID=UPI0018A44E99|nr:response regulator [Arcobacter sp. FWKO B]QOG12742.1 response regulator [Arcobacter sp. FWKO B]